MKVKPPFFQAVRYTLLHFPSFYIVDTNNAILSFIHYIRLMEMVTGRAKVRIGNILLRTVFIRLTALGAY